MAGPLDFFKKWSIVERGDTSLVRRIELLVEKKYSTRLSEKKIPKKNKNRPCYRQGIK